MLSIQAMLKIFKNNFIFKTAKKKKKKNATKILHFLYILKVKQEMAAIVNT